MVPPTAVARIVWHAQKRGQSAIKPGMEGLVSVKDGVSGGIRLIKMLVELHRRGYQLLRICPYEHMAWAVEFWPSRFFSPRNGAYLMSGAYVDLQSHEETRHSAGSGFRYFGWSGVERYDAQHLAGEFVKRFPKTCAASQGRDWEYAGWLSELSGHVSRTRRLPFVSAEYFEPAPEELMFLPLRDYENGGEITQFPLPPPVVSTERALIEERDELRAKVEQLRNKVSRAIEALR